MTLATSQKDSRLPKQVVSLGGHLDVSLVGKCLFYEGKHSLVGRNFYLAPPASECAPTGSLSSAMADNQVEQGHPNKGNTKSSIFLRRQICVDSLNDVPGRLILFTNEQCQESQSRMGFALYDLLP